MQNPGEVIVTGASGFIGGHVCEALRNAGAGVRRFSRQCYPSSDTRKWVQFDVESAADCSVLEGARAVIHLAARAHILDDRSRDGGAEFFKANVEGTRKLAELALKAGVKRLVFVSSIGVNGNATGDTSFTERSTPAPVDLYAASKYEAEQALAELADKSSLELVIVRPPLVYGPGNPGNFLRLLKLVKSGFPLPIGAVNNLKSLIYVENLASALIECANNPAAANQTYLVSDGHDISTADLVRNIAACMHRPSRVMPVPQTVLYGLAKMAGKAATLDKLASSLVVDSSKIREQLAWSPPVAFHDGLKRTVNWFISEDSPA